MSCNEWLKAITMDKIKLAKYVSVRMCVCVCGEGEGDRNMLKRCGWNEGILAANEKNEYFVSAKLA